MSALSNVPGYELIELVQGSVGGPAVRLGIAGVCRFCGETRAAKFKNVAHTFPEALGNKWVVSLDECDGCNSKFSVFEDALAKALGPLLTVGGVRGKNNRVRQTGRTAGAARLVHDRVGGQRRLSINAVVDDPKRRVVVDTETGRLTLDVPVPSTPYVPRLAYRALAKMGFALLPQSELKDFEALRRWLDADFPTSADFLKVGLSFASVGNSPPLVSGALLRKVMNEPRAPTMIFIFSAGSVCAQIDLCAGSATKETPASRADLRIFWRSIVEGKPTETPLTFDYGEPVQLNWSSASSEACPFESLQIEFDPSTSKGVIRPTMRRSTLGT